MAKRTLCILLALVTMFSLTAPAFAEGEVVEPPAPAEEPVITEEPAHAEEPVITEAPAEAETPVEVPEVPVEVPEVPVEVPEVPVEVPEEPAEVPEEPTGVPEEPAEIPEEPAEVPEAVEEPEPAAIDEPMPAAESSPCGNGVNYSMTDDGVLTVSGTGAISDEAFMDRDDIKMVFIEDGVTGIGSHAFAGCKELTGVTIPASLKSTGSYVFSACTALKDVTLREGLSSIGEYMFNSCYDLASVTIPDSVTSIEKGAFYSTGLTSVTIPGSVKSIGDDAFGQCWGLDSVTICEGVQTIGKYAFLAEGLAKVEVPASVVSIGREAFGSFHQESILGEIYIYNPDCQLAYDVGDPDLPMTIYGFTPWTFTVHGYDGSTAQAYANAFENISFVSMGAAPGTGAADPGTGTTPTDPDSGLTPVPTPEPTAKPAQPKVSKVTNTADGVTVTWNAVEGAATYTVYYKTGTGKWKKLADTAETSYTWTKAKSGTKYSFSVSATNIIGSSKYNKTGKSITYMAAPKVKSAKIDASGVKITWAKVNGAAKYQVMYKTNNGKWKSLAKSVTGTSYTWKKAKAGNQYGFSVIAIAKDGTKSAYSGTGKSLVYVSAPKLKSVKKVSGGIKITWGKVNGAVEYQVMYKVGSGKWKTLAKSVTGTSYTWKKAKNGTKYTFSVRAVAWDGTKGVYNTTGKSITYKK